MPEKPEFGSWIRSKTFLSVFGTFFVILFIILLAVINVTTQIDDIEEKLRYIPPQGGGATIVAESVLDGQSVYVPVYSHIYVQEGSPFLLEATLSIRNTDPNEAMQIESVRYFNTQGKLIKTYADKPIRLEPLATIEFLVPQQKTKGGSGANFIVKWIADTRVNRPIIEAVMAGIDGQASISFVRTGIEIKQNDIVGSRAQ